MGDKAVPAMFDTELEAFATLARGLTTEQWQVQSLCAGWNVRDVVVHAAFHTHRAGLKETLGSTEKYTARLIAREHAETIDGLLAWLASPAPAAARKSKVNLNELVIHQQDVRRPLGSTRVYPDATMRMCLEFCTTVAGTYLVCDSKRRRGRGVRLVATDLEWSSGSGPEVSGTGDALLMAIAGRPGALADLTGAGVPILAERLGGTRSTPIATP
jgi:uncharacterized protein (TIGR03083 family)